MSTIQPTPASTFQQVTRPIHPTACEVESYRLDANRAGRADAIAHLRNGRPGSAFRRIVETTEAEARILGLAGVWIPTARRAWNLTQGKRGERR